MLLIDIETSVYARVAGALREEYGSDGIFPFGEYIDAPARFPAVTILEADNQVYSKMSTTRIENAVKLLYEVNVFSNMVGYGKIQAQKIMNIVDREMAAMGFTRTACGPVSNLMDPKITRMMARYEGVADREYRIYTH